MRNILAAAAVAALAGAANAADMDSPAGGLKDTPYVVAPSWTGFYVGANLGGGFADLRSTVDVAGTNVSSLSNNASGVAGGGQLGYNYQMGSFVFGAEFDFGGLGLQNTALFPFTDAGTTINNGFYLDVTGRLGYAAGPALFYAKGGYAWFDGPVGLTAPVPDGNITHSGLNGLTIGGGIEYKINPTWSVKGEYQLFAFQRLDFTDTDVTIHNYLTVNTVKVGVNYFVGNVYTPLK
jgi:outer membrane immunogenic protein